MTFKTFIVRAAIDPAKDPKGHTMKYTHEYVIHCGLFRMKSNQAYTYARKTRLLRLPSPSTIRRLLSSSECKFGFNELALEHILQALKGLKPHERWGCLLWDEITIKKDLRFDTRSLKWKGIVDYGGATKIMVPNGLSDHVLVFVFRPFLGSWIQPFAWFATKGGASGSLLVELIMKAISALFDSAGAIVTAGVLDGYSTNVNAVLQFGVTGTEDGNCSIAHPYDDKVQIHFLVDVPHLLKCTRNHMLKHKVVQVS